MAEAGRIHFHRYQNMKTASVENDTCKSVEWSYPTSDNAKRFGFYSTAMAMSEVQQGIRRQQLLQAFGAVESVRCQIQHDSIRTSNKEAFKRLAKDKKRLRKMTKNL